MPEPFAPLVRDQRAALLGLLSDVAGEDWERLTVCDPWTVKDVVAHLVEGELQFGRLYRGEIDELATDTEEGVDRWRRVDGDTVRYSLWHHGQAAQRVIDTRPDKSWGRQVTNFGEPMELRRALPIHFFELGVHSHDVSVALGKPPIWGDRAGPLVEYIIGRATSALAETPASGSIEVRIPEVGPRTLDGRSGGWILLDQSGGDGAGDPAATWHTDAETLVLVTTGRLAIPDAIAHSKVEGDPSLLERVLADWRPAR